MPTSNSTPSDTHLDPFDLVEYVAVRRGIVTAPMHPDRKIQIETHLGDGCHGCLGNLCAIADQTNSWEELFEKTWGAAEQIPCFDRGILQWLLDPSEEFELGLGSVVFICHAEQCSACKELFINALTSLRSSRAFARTLGLDQSGAALSAADFAQITALAVGPECKTTSAVRKKRRRRRSRHPNEMDLFAYGVNAHAGNLIQIQGIPEGVTQEIEQHLDRCPQCLVQVKAFGELVREALEGSNRLRRHATTLPCPPSELVERAVGFGPTTSLSREEAGVVLMVEAHVTQCDRCRPQYRAALWQHHLRGTFGRLLEGKGDDLAWTLQQFS